ncbi:transcription factor c2h2 protein [Rutstroemia sp. NJR-2017a BVV2]|nr:transcription factor c2h2 protein [Rutstroemia sp. NJR-2017a BVV2]
MQQEREELGVDEKIDPKSQNSKPDTEQPSPAYNFGKKSVSKANSDSGYSTGTTSSDISSANTPQVVESMSKSKEHNERVPSMSARRKSVWDSSGYYTDMYGSRDADKYGLRGADMYGSRDADKYGLRGADMYGSRDADMYGPRDSTDINKLHDSSRDSVRRRYSITDIHKDYDSGHDSVVKPQSITKDSFYPLYDEIPGESIRNVKLEHTRSTFEERMESSRSMMGELPTKSSARKDWLPGVKDMPRAFMPTDDDKCDDECGRPPWRKVLFCTNCNRHSSGFLNIRDLERHVDTAHKYERTLRSLPKSERISPGLGSFTEQLRGSTERRPDFSEDNEDNAWDSDSPKSLLRSRPRFRNNDTEEMITETALRIARDLIKVSSFANRNFDNEGIWKEESDAVDALWKEVRVRVHEERWSLAKIDLYEDKIMRAIHKVITDYKVEKMFEKRTISSTTKVASQSTSTLSLRGKRINTEEDLKQLETLLRRLYLEENLTYAQIRVKLRSEYNIIIPAYNFTFFTKTMKRWGLKTNLRHPSELTELLELKTDDRTSLNTTSRVIERAPSEHISEDKLGQSISENSSSDEESVGSVGKSVVSTNSIISGTSLSSISEEVSSEVIALLATERFLKLIVEDIMVKSYCIYAFRKQSMSREHFQRNLVRWLRIFGIELRKEAQTDYERQAAQQFQVRARKTAHLICDRVISGTDYPDEGSEVELDDSSDDASDASDASKYISTCLQGLKTFVRDSRAHQALRERLFSFVRSPETISSLVATGQQEPSLQQQDLATTSNPDKGSEETRIKRSLDDSKKILSEDNMIVERQAQTLPEVSNKQDIAGQIYVSEENDIPIAQKSTLAEESDESSSLIEPFDVTGIKNEEESEFPPVSMSSAYNPPGQVPEVGLSEKVNVLISVIRIGRSFIAHQLRRILIYLPRRGVAPVAEGKVRIEWYCKCGQRLYDDFTELKPGAAEELRESLNHQIQNDWPRWIPFFDNLHGIFASQDANTIRPTDSNRSHVEKISNIGSLTNSYMAPLLLVSSFFRRILGSQSAKGLGPSLPTHQPVNTQLNATGSNPGNSSSTTIESLFLLLCYGEGRYSTRLLQLDLHSLDATSDQTIFRLLGQNYRQMRGRWISCISLRTLTSIKFVRFEMYRSSLVDVRQKDDVPPPGHVEYRYLPTPPDLVPPIGENHMMHLFQHPDHADEETVCLDRFPKKLKERLQCKPGTPTSIGWGLEFVEDWDWKFIWWIAFAVLGLGSLLMGVLWVVFKHSVQDAFAIAAYMVAFVGVSVGALQSALMK